MFNYTKTLCSSPGNGVFLALYLQPASKTLRFSCLLKTDALLDLPACLERGQKQQTNKHLAGDH